MSACRFMLSNSATVSFPGLFRMCSGIASLPHIVQKRGGLDCFQLARIAHA